MNFSWLFTTALSIAVVILIFIAKNDTALWRVLSLAACALTGSVIYHFGRALKNGG